MTEQLPLNTSPLPVKLRVEDYLLLEREGALANYARTELIEGEIVFMNAQHRPHARIKTRLYDAIRVALEEIGIDLEALVEASIAAPPHSVPEPDIVITSEAEGEGLVPLASVALIVEVADTTLANDLGSKSDLYASLGVPEYWIADTNGRVTHQLWGPTKHGYAQRRTVAFGEELAAATIERLRVSTATLQ